jgi:putative NADH-flavin reductase
MKIVVFGSTGSIGSVLVKQALDRGHVVTAFTRSPEKVSTRHRNFDILHGDVQNPNAVVAAVSDKDAVFITLGDGRKGDMRFAGNH